MSHIIDKRITLNNQPTHHTYPNSRVLFLIIINHQQLAAVHADAIVIYATNIASPLTTIPLPFQPAQIAYNPPSELFVLLPKCPDLSACQLYALSHSHPSQPRPYYRYQQKRGGVKQFEWQSWLKSFELSSRVVLIRKFYGYSLCVVFDLTNNQLSRRREFKINEECISKLDEQKYLANYRQMITRYSLLLQIVNVETSRKSEYKITEQIVHNTTKSVKLWRKEAEILNQKQYTSLTVMIAMNTKFQGYALMIVKLLEDTNNYMIVDVIQQNKYEIYKVFPIDHTRSVQFTSLEYRYDQKQGRVDFVLCNYQLDQNKHQFSQTDAKVIQCQFQGMAYSLRDRQLVMFEGGVLQQGLSASMFKVVDKAVLYAYVLGQMGCRWIRQQIIDLLA